MDITPHYKHNPFPYSLTFTLIMIPSSLSPFEVKFADLDIELLSIMAVHPTNYI